MYQQATAWIKSEIIKGCCNVSRVWKRAPVKDLCDFIYKQVDSEVEKIGVALIKELKAAGEKIEI